jgi:hypothetical protein
MQTYNKLGMRKVNRDERHQSFVRAYEENRRHKLAVSIAAIAGGLLLLGALIAVAVSK